MEQLREEVIEICHQIAAIEEKAACREVKCVVLDQLTVVQREVFRLKELLTEITNQ